MIFVTGGTGMLGSHLLYDLVKKDCKVRALVRNTEKIKLVEKIFGYYDPQASLLLSKIEWVEGDIRDFDKLMEYLSGVDLVYHSAALVSFDAKDKEELYNINVEGTSAIVNASIDSKIKKFCHVSSITTLGSTLNGSLIDEETERNPKDNRSNYSKTKYFSELEVWRGTMEGLNAVIVNPSVILGPGDWNNGSPELFSTVWTGLNFYTLGGTGFVDVRDVVSAMTGLMESDISNERFIVSAENLSFKRLFDLISIAFGKKAPLIPASPFMTEFAWRFEAIKSLFTGKRGKITRETARSAHKISEYSNRKIKDLLSIEFRPIEQSIKDISTCFLNNQLM